MPPIIIVYIWILNHMFNKTYNYSFLSILTNKVEMAPFLWVKGNWYRNTEFECVIYFNYYSKLQPFWTNLFVKVSITYFIIKDINHTPMHAKLHDKSYLTTKSLRSTMAFSRKEGGSVTASLCNSMLLPSYVVPMTSHMHYDAIYL